MNTSFAGLDRFWEIEAGALDEMLAQLQRADLSALRMKPPAERAAQTYSRYGSVAVLDINGPLSKTPSLWSMLGFAETSTVEAGEAIAAAVADPQVTAILLRVDSPGGSVRGTGDLADAIYAARQKKRVVAFIEDLGASAAYHLASQASRVYANRGAIVGSIGVYAVVSDWSKLYDNAGVKVHVIRAGAMKGVGTPGTQITPEQLAEFQRVIDASADLFIADVARGRGIGIDKAKGLADGRVHVGEAARNVGLVDAIRKFDDIVAELQGTGSTTSQQKAASQSLATTPAASSRPAATSAVRPPVQPTTAANGSLNRSTGKMSTTTTYEGGAIGEFGRRVAKCMQTKGLDRHEAVSAVIKADHRLHLLYLAESNEKDGRSQIAEDLRAQAARLPQ